MILHEHHIKIKCNQVCFREKLMSSGKIDLFRIV